MAAVQSSQGLVTPQPGHRQRVAEGLGSQAARKPDALLPLCLLSLLFFLCNSAVAIYRARDDPREAAFVTVVSLDMIGLFVAVGAHDRAPPEDASRLRRNLRVVIWALAASLSFAFSYRVAAMVPAAVSLAIWALAAFVALAGLWLLVLECRGCHKARGGQSPKDPLLEEGV